MSDPTLPSGAVPPKKRMHLGCQIALGITIAILLIGAYLALSAVRAKNWVEQNAESKPQTFPKPELTAEEEQGLDRLYWKHWKAYQEKSDLDLSFSVPQFNAFAERDIAQKKKEGTLKGNEAEAAQIGFEGEQLVIRGAWPQGDGLYRNLEVRGKLAIENKQIEWSLDEVKMGGESAPWLAMLMIRKMIQSAVDAYSKGSAPDASNPMEMIKLFRREGDHFHLILDGSHLPSPHVKKGNP